MSPMFGGLLSQVQVLEVETQALYSSGRNAGLCVPARSGVADPGVRFAARLCPTLSGLFIIFPVGVAQPAFGSFQRKILPV